MCFDLKRKNSGAVKLFFVKKNRTSKAYSDVVRHVVMDTLVLLLRQSYAPSTTGDVSAIRRALFTV